MERLLALIELHTKEADRLEAHAARIMYAGDEADVAEDFLSQAKRVRQGVETLHKRLAELSST